VVTHRRRLDDLDRLAQKGLDQDSPRLVARDAAGKQVEQGRLVATPLKISRVSPRSAKCSTVVTILASWRSASRKAP
jgi:hypothetical protein